MRRPDVNVTVEGGVASVEVHTLGVVVEVRDYDVDGVTDVELWTDSHGDQCVRYFERFAKGPAETELSTGEKPMSERFCAWIRIGGQVHGSTVKPLLEAIAQAGVSLDWGDGDFAPTDASELLDARKDGWLRLCDDQANYGEFPEIEKACQRLGLSYTRHCEGTCSYDAELIDWRPGMKQPLVRTGSNASDDKTFVAAEAVQRALKAFEAGQVDRARKMLRELCPDVPDLPHFQIV